MSNFFARKTGAVALGLSFLMASAGVGQESVSSAPQTTPTPSAPTPAAPTPGHQYYSYDKYGVVLDVWRCPESGVCMQVHSVDPDNEKLQHFVADRIGKKVDDVTPADMRKLCGYRPHLFNMNERKAPAADGEDGGKWTGRVDISTINAVLRGTPAAGSKVYGLDIELKPAQDTLHIYGFIPGLPHFIGGGADLSAVPNPGPACAAPAP